MSPSESSDPCLKRCSGIVLCQDFESTQLQAMLPAADFENVYNIGSTDDHLLKPVILRDFFTQIKKCPSSTIAKQVYANLYVTIVSKIGHFAKIVDDVQTYKKTVIIKNSDKNCFIVTKTQAFDRQFDVCNLTTELQNAYESSDTLTSEFVLFVMFCKIFGAIKNYPWQYLDFSDIAEAFQEQMSESINLAKPTV